jgi:exodeoxyribonuclease V gamma subunit
MLNVWQSNRLERLADRLAEIVRAPVGPPLSPETIVVQNSGMKRWLSMRLATRLGICANVSFPLPAELLWGIFRTLLPDVPESPSVEPSATTWAIMGLLSRLEPDSRFAPVHAYLGSAVELPEVARYELARRIADVFAQYVVFRPDWIRAWEAGRAPRLAREESFADEAWQSELWRRLARSDGHSRHFARLEEEIHARLRGGEREAPSRAPSQSGARRQLDLFEVPRPEPGSAPARGLPGLSALPRRIALFGIPALPPAMLEIVRHLAQHVDVHLLLLNPSRAYWFDIRTHREQLRETERSRGLDPALLHRDVGNGLLASLGKQSRDCIASLLAYDDESVRHHELFETPGGDDRVPTTAADAERRPLLGVLQLDVLDLRDRGGGPPGGPHDERFPPPAPVAMGDASLQVHVCHGPMREIEVLHDRLLDLFERNPDLLPPDVVVMTPEIERYAPCIEAVFATAPEERRIPFSIADRSLAADSPLVAAFLALLELPGSRYDANRVLDLLALTAVQRRFGLEAGEVERIQRWVRRTNVRWGIDESTAVDIGLPACREHTWAFGLDRLLLGCAMAGGGTRLVADILPYDDVEGADARTVGRLAAFARAVFDVERSLAASRSPASWSQCLADLLERVFLPDDEEEPFAQSIRKALTELGEAADVAGFGDDVSLELVRLHLRRQLELPASQGRFLAGQVTFCALVPMRSIPFEVVCLVGMNDGAFPRSHRPPGFDLIAREPRHGDRSRREDDRYLFLEALLSARSCLHVSYVGRSVRDNGEIPPSVLVSELLDTVQRGFFLDGDEHRPVRERATRIREHVVVEHPLQAFSPRYFSGDTRLYSYAAELCAATREALSERLLPTPLVRSPLPEPEEWGEVDVDRLVRFFQDPARAFLESRLDIRLLEGEGLVEASEPFALDGLPAYHLRRDLLDLMVAGVSAQEALALARARGHLPHGSVGSASFAAIERQARSYFQRLQELRSAEAPTAVAVSPLEAGALHLAGTLAGVTTGGRVEGRPGLIGARDRLAAWIRHLVLCALARRGRLPRDTACRTVYLGVDATLVFRQVDDADLRLAELADAYRRGLCEPLPFFPESAYAYAAAHRGRGTRDPLEVARETFGKRRADDRWAQLVFRDTDPLGEVFTELARTIMAPLIAALEGAGR